MKFSMQSPPGGGNSVNESLDAIIAWLYVLYETLSVVLENLGTDNFSSEMKSFFEEGRNND